MLMRLILSALIVLLTGPAAVGTQSGAAAPAMQEHWNLFTPEQIAWQDGPASLLPGAKVAILEGDPTRRAFSRSG
jgi:hypothetical protein